MENKVTYDLASSVTTNNWPFQYITAIVIYIHTIIIKQNIEDHNHKAAIGCKEKEKQHEYQCSYLYISIYMEICLR